MNNTRVYGSNRVIIFGCLIDVLHATGQSATGGSPYERLRRSHGVLNMVGWGILMIIGAMVARYFREKDPLWFYFHGFIQLFGFILGLVGIICGFVLNNRLHAAVSTHKGLGIFILVLGCLQVCIISLIFQFRDITLLYIGFKFIYICS